jgi:hypothetical protein
MTERSEPNDRGDKGSEESLGEVRDRLSEFTRREDEHGEERSDEPEPADLEPDVGENETEGNASDPGNESRDSTLVVKTAVRERIEGMAVASDFYEPLNEAVNELLDDAARRARANGRKTVQRRDL